MIYVILDHRHEPDRLYEQVYFDDWGDANRVAETLRVYFDCKNAAIEVVELRKVHEW
jgi:hypothetical protein